MKKLIALVLCVVMIVALSANAFAKTGAQAIEEAWKALATVREYQIAKMVDAAAQSAADAAVAEFPKAAKELGVTAATIKTAVWAEFKAKMDDAAGKLDPTLSSEAKLKAFVAAAKDAYSAAGLTLQSEIFDLQIAALKLSIEAETKLTPEQKAKFEALVSQWS